MTDPETYLVTVGRDAKHRRTVTRHPIPHKDLAIALARQHYEGLSDRAISDTITNLVHEQHRRKGTLAQLGGWDPDQTQHRGSNA